MAVTVVDIQASSFDAATGAITGISAVRLAPDIGPSTLPFDWRLLVRPATGSLEDETRRQLDAFALVWPELSAYLAETLVVAHGATRARTFLRKATLAVDADWEPPSILCTRRMARTVFPGLDSYELGVLVAELVLAPEQPSGGAERCSAVAELFRRCIGRIGETDSAKGANLHGFISGPIGAVGRG